MPLFAPDWISPQCGCCCGVVPIRQRGFTSEGTLSSDCGINSNSKCGTHTSKSANREPTMTRKDRTSPYPRSRDGDAKANLARLQIGAWALLDSELASVIRCHESTPKFWRDAWSMPLPVLPKHREMLALLHRNPGFTAADIAHCLGCSKRTMHHRLRTMERRTLVHRVKRIGVRAEEWHTTDSAPNATQIAYAESLLAAAAE